MHKNVVMNTVLYVLFLGTTLILDVNKAKALR